MFTFDEKKEYFISECKNKKYMMKKLSYLNDELDYLHISLEGEQNYRSKELILNEETALKEKRQITDRLNYIDDVIVKVRDPQVRGMITDLWINRYSKKKVSIIYHFSSEYIYEKIKNELKKTI